jgi:hypothetical protein
MSSLLFTLAGEAGRGGMQRGSQAAPFVAFICHKSFKIKKFSDMLFFLFLKR